MSKRTFLKRLTGFNALGLAAVLAGLSVFWACHLNEADGRDRFDLRPDSAFAACDSLMVILQDTAGLDLDTLFNDTLRSLSQLNGLSAERYPGGKARVRIVGRKAGGPCVEQTRAFDDHGGPVVVDTLVISGTPPGTVAIDPATLEVSVGDPSVNVLAVIRPSFAEQAFEWSVDDPSVATLDFPYGAGSGKAVVVPLKNGTATIRVSAKRDNSKSADLTVHVGTVEGKTISLSPDSLDLYLGAPDSVLSAKVSPEGSDEPIAWTSSDEKVAKVDSKGKVKAVGEGVATIKARFGGASALAKVKVKRDAPVLTVASKSGAAVNVPIVFSPRATQDFGSITMFKWDLDGTGGWDDSLPGPFLGTAVDLPAQTAKYPKQGQFKASFLVRDSEGNETSVSVNLEIGDQAPEILVLSKDTIISIRDSIPLRARARDLESKVAWIGWDYENDGKFDDTLKTSDSTVDFKRGHRYDKPGKYAAVLRVEDDNGKARTDTVRVGVVLDPPVADAGNDTTVIAGSPVNFHVMGTDKFGAIAKRELKVADGPFLNLSKQDTSFRLPGDAGTVICVARVTDDDDNSDEDTLIVTIIAPSKSNDNLAGLVPSAGLLTPVFKPVTLLYSLAVAYADSQVTLIATTSDTAASLAINGKPVASGQASDPVDVKVGTTMDAFKVVVTAQDGSQKLYSLSVTRAPSADASLSKLAPAGFSLKPAFAPATFDYADTVANAVASVSLKPTAAHPAAQVAVNDSAVASGASSKALPLVVGDNLIKIQVTAQDGKTKLVYNVKVVRRAKLILTRQFGADSPARTDSLEFPLGTTANISSPDSIGFHFQKWVVTEGAATLADSAANPGKLTLKSATVRAKGVFAINTYTITTGVAGAVGGLFTPSTVTIEHGKDTTITVTPLAGFRVLSVKDSGKAVATLGTVFGAKTYKLVKVTGNHVLQASFMRYYVMSAKVNAGNGSVVDPVAPVNVDSGSSFTFRFKTTVVGSIPSTLLDGGVNVLPAGVGDSMATFSYTVKADKDHDVVAGYAVKTFTLKVYGHDLCVNQVVVCSNPLLCLTIRCLAGTDSTTIQAPYGSSYNLYTNDSLGTRPFVSWIKDGTTGAVATTNSYTTPAITADATYRATYKSIIINCCLLGTCCVINDPPIIKQPGVLEPILTAPAPSTSAQ